MKQYTKDQEAFLEQAKRLEGSTIRKTNKKYGTSHGKPVKSGEPPAPEKKRNPKNKGAFGEVLEEVYFGKANDNLPQPDFPEIGVELKTSPLKRLKNHELRVKERMVLHRLSYMDMDKETFKTPSLLKKASLIMVVFFIFSNTELPEDQEIILVAFWNFIMENWELVKRDLEYMHDKVHEGKAEEISEGATLLLGACPKGANAATNMQRQPHSDVMVIGRALCIKRPVVDKFFHDQMLLRAHRVLNETRFLENEHETMEEAINRRFAPFMGKTVIQICDLLQYYPVAKSKYALIARKILGFKKGCSFFEFSAAGIQVKAIRREQDGSVKESMSFRSIDYKEIVDQEWEDSDLYQDLTCKFVMVIFQKSPDGSDYILQNVRFWNMPQADLNIVRVVWENTKIALAEDDFLSLPRKSDQCIAHVRTHGANGKKVSETVTGKKETRRSFWLNNDYILKAIVQG